MGLICETRISMRCAECKEIMHFEHAWVTKPNLVIIIVKCECGRSDHITIEPSQQPLTGEWRKNESEL